MFRLLILLCLFLPAQLSAQDSRLRPVKMNFEGANRMYLSYAPRRIARSKEPRPLIIVLHGGGGTARQIARGTSRRFDQLADKHGFFVVYPNAIGKLWDTGGGKISNGLSPRRNDLGFLQRVIDDMARKYPIDRQRVFAAGMSRGGHASFMLACRTNKIRAIAPVAMNLPKHLTADCKRAKPTGLLMINGTKDPLVPINGGRITLRGKPRDLVESADQSLAVFARRNGCTGVSDSRRINKADDGTVVQYKKWNCAKAATANFKVIRGGHTWPSEKSIIPERLVGLASRDIVATDEIVKFFLRF